jgi:RNA polymerase sigma-70 factor (ECF subfamily)
VDHGTIIQRVLSGDNLAYAELVRHYQRMVYTVCFRVLRNMQDAEEATQDSFVKTYQHLAGFGGHAKFSTWLYSIAYRTAISHGRKRHRDLVSVDDLPHHPVAANDANGHRAEMRRILEQALAQLDPEDASILSFHHLEELSVEEIVTITGMGASNVKVRLHRARKKLREVVQANYGNEALQLIMDHA